MASLRGAIQTITHNLPIPVRDLGISIIGETCYNTLLLDISLESPDCIKLAMSKTLGIGIIAASSVVKVPQILKLLNSHSASGISFLSYLLETLAYLISLAYNVRQGFPFSTYGETSFILLQNVAIAVLVLHYRGKASAAALFVVGLATSVLGLFQPSFVGMKVLKYLQAGAGALGIASKLPQILIIWQEGGTGQLSAFAVFNFLLGSLARIFTTLQEIDDKLILYGFITGFALNAVLAVQVVYYWNRPVKQLGRRTVHAPLAATVTSSATLKAKSPTTRRRG